MSGCHIFSISISIERLPPGSRQAVRQENGSRASPLLQDGRNNLCKFPPASRKAGPGSLSECGERPVFRVQAPYVFYFDSDPDPDLDYPNGCSVPTLGAGPRMILTPPQTKTFSKGSATGFCEADYCEGYSFGPKRRSGPSSGGGGWSSGGSDSLVPVA